MKEPKIKRFPTEIFGHPYNSIEKATKEALGNQFCPFINSTCKKPRKSEPHIKVGICSVGYKGDFNQEYKPVIICPLRFNVRAVFKGLEQSYMSHWKGNIEWVSEVGMGVGGNIDYVAIIRNSKGEIINFLCVEFQAAGTTGTPYQAVKDMIEHGAFQSDGYPYGINWANEFMKTMMQQVYKKGRIIESWNREIVFVIQDVAMDYIRSAVNTEDLNKSENGHPIHFCTFKMEWRGDSWNLAIKELLSTTLDGVSKILGGAGIEHYPTLDEFKSSIIRKGKAGGVIWKLH